MPTPQAADASGGRYNSEGHQDTLPGVARLLPTPTTSDTNGAGAHGDGGTDLRTTVSRMLPMPTSRDWKDHTIRREPHRPDDTDTLARALTDVPCALLPTPTSQAAKHSGGDTDRGPGSPDDANLWIIAQRNQWGDYAPAIHRWEQILGRPAPAPTMTSAKGNPQLSPRFVEWMMGLPEGWVDDVPNLTRNEKLKALGNGVVSQQAVEAVLRLLALGSEVAA